VDVCRLNLSHAELDDHKTVLGHIRSIKKEFRQNTAILIDLQGPKLRIGEVANNAVLLEAGKEIEITTNECIGNATCLFINYEQFPKDVAIGDHVLIDDGKIQLTVTGTNRKDSVKAVIDSGGILTSRKGVNLPKTTISLPSLT